MDGVLPIIENILGIKMLLVLRKLLCKLLPTDSNKRELLRYSLLFTIALFSFSLFVDILVYLECREDQIKGDISIAMLLWNMLFTEPVCSTGEKVWVHVQFWRYQPYLGSWLTNSKYENLMVGAVSLGLFFAVFIILLILMPF